MPLESSIEITDDFTSISTGCSKVMEVLKQILPAIQSGEAAPIRESNVNVRHLASHLVRRARKIKIEVTTRSIGEFVYVRMK